MQCEGQLPVEDIKQNSDKEEAGSAGCRMWKEWGNGNGNGNGMGKWSPCKDMRLLTATTQNLCVCTHYKRITTLVGQLQFIVIYYVAQSMEGAAGAGAGAAGTGPGQREHGWEIILYAARTHWIAGYGAEQKQTA